jgi:hypothetical protein
VKHSKASRDEVKCRRGRCRARGGAGLLVLALLAGGCSHLKMSSSPPKAEVNSRTLGGASALGSVSLSQFQSETMRFADDYATAVAQACDDLGAKAPTDAIRVAALRWKLAQSTAAYTDATGPNPVLNGLDLVVLATVSRMVVEELTAGPYGDLGLPLLETHRKFETNAWLMTDGVLKPEQQQEMRDMIRKWREQNPHQRYVGAVRFREFATALGEIPKANTFKPNSIFSLLYLDPMAGLDPTARAIEETRELAERMMYYAERSPALLSWQIELLTYKIADQPAAQQLLADADRVSKTAEQLPKLANDQRTAAIQQLLDGLAAERTNLLASLGAEETKLRELLAETRGTLQTGKEMANSVNAAIQSLDAFIHYVSPPNTNLVTVVDTNSRPFDILDYGTAATQIGTMAKDLGALLAAVNQTAPEIARLSRETEAGAARTVDRAFWRGLVLIVMLLVGAVLAGLAYRLLAHKLTRRRRDDPGSSP